MLAVQDNKLVLQKTHSTNYQIQCQLALTGAQFCDLIVYTFKSMAIIRVKFDDNFWNEVVNIIVQDITKINNQYRYLSYM